MTRPHLLRIAVATALVLAAAGPVRAQTWNAPNTSPADWNTAAHWTPATVPNSTTAAVVFPDVLAGQTGQVGTVNISSSVSAQSLSLTNTVGSYTITSSASQTLSGVQAITVAAGVTGTETINLGNVAAGSLLFPSGSGLTVTNNSTVGGELTIGPNTVIGTAGNGGVTFAGPGATTFSGSFGSGSIPGGLSETGPGSLDYTGNGANLSGAVIVNGGTLTLDYSGNTASKFFGGGLASDGGILTTAANSGTPVTQSITTISFQAGQTTVQGAGTGTISLAVGAISRSTGATADITPSAGSLTFSVTASAGTTNGLLGTGPAYATVNGGASWATVTSGAIASLATYGTNTYTSGTNTDVATSASEVGIITNSLRFNTGSPTLTLSGTNTLQSGGILATPSATGGTITGGTLTGPNSGELIVHQYGSGAFTINSALVSTVGLTTTGTGNLALGGTNSGLTGPINVNHGSLTVTNTAAINSASAINFNDNRRQQDVQAFTVDLGSGVNGTISPPISLSAFSATNYGTYFSTGNSGSSTVTLSGVVSSAAGLTTTIAITGGTGNDTSGFNLTNNNTFTGNVNLFQGSLGINSDASLGNAANTLFLQVGDTVNGGLVFLSSGITVAHAVTETFSTRIVCNGTNSNTISGLITSNGGTLYKDGTGTLTITNPNNNLAGGGVFVTAGTLSLGSTGHLGAGTNITVNAGATFSPGTSGNIGSPIGTVTLLGGGVFSVSSGGGQFLVNQIVSNGGAINYTGSTNAQLVLVNTGTAITVTGNSTWLSQINSATISNIYVGTGTVPITISAGMTLTNGIALASGPYGFQITGGGTLYQDSDSTNVLGMSATITVSQGEFRVTDASSNNGVGNLGTGTFTLDGGTLSYGGSTASTSKPITLTTNARTIQVESAGATLTDSGAITGLGGLTKTGPGTLTFTSTGNTYSGGTIVNQGTLNVTVAGELGVAGAPVTINPLGTLLYSDNVTSSRTYSTFDGSLAVAAGNTLTFNNATVGGGYLVGNFATVAGASTTFVGNTARPSTTLALNGTDSLTNFTQGGQLTVAAGQTITMTGLTNQGSGSITVAATGTVNVAAFQTYGLLTLNPAVVGSGTYTELMNTGTSEMYFNGGSRTFIGTPATATSNGSPTFVAGIDLHGNNAEVAGGLFVNNGFVVDGSMTGTATVVADFGALVKGAGYFQNTVITQNGGKFQAGNSPGSAAFGNFVFGPGGVGNYVFAIDDATGSAGPSPNALGHVGGWGLIKSIQQAVGSFTSSGNFTWTATPADPLMVALNTLVNPTIVGADISGPMADFDPTKAYSWLAAQWTGTYSGPTDAATLNADTAFDTSGFVNQIDGTFGWSLGGSSLSLTYTPTPVPEPGTLALVGLAAVGLARWRRQGQPASRPRPGPVQ